MLLNILHLEDSDKDAELIRSMLEADGFECRVTRVETRDDFARELERGAFDLIVAGHTLPPFDGISALRMVREKEPDDPFILISGTLGEDKAVEALKLGASDYLLKQNLHRLGAAVRSALHHAEETRMRKRAEETLNASEVRYRRLFEAARDGILILDAETGMIVDVNPFLVDMLGYSREQFLEKEIWEVGVFKDIAANKSNFTELQQKEFIQYENLPLETADGRVINVEFVSHVYQVDHKKVIQCNIRDITGRKEAEAALMMSEDRFKKAFDHAAIGKAVVSTEGRWLAVNESLCRMLGYTEEELLQGTFQEITFPEDLDTDLHYVQEMLMGKRERYQMEKRYVQKQGNVVWALLSVSLVKEKDGKPLYFIAEIEDITERKQAEANLVILKKAIETSREGFFLTDAEGMFTFVNAGFSAIYGYTADEVIGKVSPRILKSGLLTKEYYEGFWKALTSGQVVRAEYKNKAKDGSLLDIDASASPIFNDEKEIMGFLGIHRDISKRKLAEDQLRQSEEQFRLITENANDLIAVLDFQGRRIYNSPSYKTILGDPAYLHGTDSFQEIHPDDRERIRGLFLETVRTGVGKRSEFRFLLEDGSIRFIESQGSVIRDQRGNVSQVVVVSRDVTEKKKQDEQYLRAQRMESLGTLAGGIAHDLNNVLAPIVLCIDVLKRGLSDARSLKILSTIQSSAFRGRDIIKQVLTFARGVEGERSLVQVRHLVSEMENIMKETFPKSIECVCAAPKDLWPLDADPTQLHQVIMNLCVNARDAMPHGGRLDLSAENLVIDEHYAGMQIDAKVGRYVVIKVADTGHGIPHKYLDKIFEPFFTTKEVGKGTGLGLATAHSIVQSHGGFINVYSEPGKGTEFKVYLPTAEGAAAEAIEEEKDSLPVGDGELILVVDDEVAILEITRQTLEAFGYRVLVARDGTEAVALYADNREKVSVVLTDLMMPIMDGVSTIRVLLKMNPAVKVIAATGMASNGSELENVGLGVQAFLHKPYRAEVLLKTLRDVLGKK